MLRNNILDITLSFYFIYLKIYRISFFAFVNVFRVCDRQYYIPFLANVYIGSAKMTLIVIIVVNEKFSECFQSAFKAITSEEIL